MSTHKNFQVSKTVSMIHNGQSVAGMTLVVDDARQHEPGFISKRQADSHAAAGRGEYIEVAEKAAAHTTKSDSDEASKTGKAAK